MNYTTIHSLCASIFLFGFLPAYAATVQTTWTGASEVDSSDWNDAQNWTAGIPNNGGGNTYSAVIGDGITTPYTYIQNGATDAITSLQILSGMLEVYTNSTLNITDTASITGRLAVSGLLSLDGALAQNTSNQLTSGRYQVGNGGIMEWSGANVQQINSGVTVELDGSGVIRNKATSTNAFAQLSSVAGSLTLYNSSLAVSGNLLNSGSILVSSDGNLTVPGTLTNTKSLQINHAQINGSVVNTSSGALNVGGSSSVLVSAVTNLDNSGNVYIFNAGELHVTGSFSQQSGTTLTAGSYQVSPGGEGGMLYNGANIQTIGANVSMTLLYGQPSGGYIRDLTTGADALAGLQTVAGKLFIGSSASQTITSNLQVTGTLTLGEQSTLATTQSAAIANAGTYEAYFRTGFSGAVSTGLLSADGGISLSGNLKVTLSLPYMKTISDLDLSGAYQIMTATGGVMGSFANASTDGDRVPVYASVNIGGTFVEQYQGSFAIDYAANGVSLGDFSTAAIPEPSTIGLVILGFLFVGYNFQKAKRLKKQGV